MARNRWASLRSTHPGFGFIGCTRNPQKTTTSGKMTKHASHYARGAVENLFLPCVSQFTLRAARFGLSACGPMENQMNHSNELVRGNAVLIGFGVIFASLIGLIAFQPKAAIWMADAVDAELSKARAAPTTFAELPKPRPIDPAAGWGQIVSK
jgi:hypothetical protein